MITRFHATGASAGSAKWWYVLRIPTTIPESPSRTTIGKSTRESPTARSKSPPGSPNGRMSSGASRMKSAVTPPRTSSVSQKSVEATRQARCLLALLEQLAEDGDERAGERRVRDERAHEVRDLDRDRERVDQPGDAEVVRADHLAHEAEHARDRGREREDGRRARDAGGCGRARRTSGVRGRLGGSIARCPSDSPSRGPATIARPAAAGASLEWRTSSNRRSASGSRRASGARTSATARRSRRSRSASRPPSRTATPSRVAAEHRELVRTIDRATTRGALHRNTAARKKSQAAKHRRRRSLLARPATRAALPARRESTSARCTSRSGASLLWPLSAPSSSARRTTASSSSSVEKPSACRKSFAA